MSKYCPAGKIECENIYQVLPGCYPEFPRRCRLNDATILELLDVCPWPSRQQAVAPVELKRKCPLDFTVPCDKSKTHCAWEADCPIYEQAVEKIERYPGPDDDPLVQAHKDGYDRGRSDALKEAVDMLNDKRKLVNVEDYAGLKLSISAIQSLAKK